MKLKWQSFIGSDDLEYLIDTTKITWACETPGSNPTYTVLTFDNGQSLAVKGELVRVKLKLASEE